MDKADSYIPGEYWEKWRSFLKPLAEKRSFNSFYFGCYGYGSYTPRKSISIQSKPNVISSLQFFYYIDPVLYDQLTKIP